MNKNKSLYAAFYIFGLLSGMIVAYDRTKNKYEKILQNEVASVKEHYAQRSDKEEKIQEPAAETDISEQDSKEDKRELQKQLNRFKYDSGIVPQDTEHPYIITPDEFGELDDYETISLIYYSDGVLADDADQMIDNVNDVVGDDVLKHCILANMRRILFLCATTGEKQIMRFSEIIGNMRIFCRKGRIWGRMNESKENRYP